MLPINVFLSVVNISIGDIKDAIRKVEKHKKELLLQVLAQHEATTKKGNIMSRHIMEAFKDLVL